MERIVKELDGRKLLESLKKIVREINGIEDERKRLGLSQEGYALLQGVRKFVPTLDERSGSSFVTGLLGTTKSKLFRGWQEKRSVVQSLEKHVFDECHNKFQGELPNREIMSMAEDAVRYLGRFEMRE